MKIDIRGPIIDDDDQMIYDWFGIKATSPTKVKRLLDKNPKGERIEVSINSGGGSVFAGSEIYTMLKECNEDVITKVVGLAASAASVIAMAGNEVQMTPTGQIMIHNASVCSRGDNRTLTHTSEILKSIDSSIATTYEMKTGLKHEELLNLMGNETWLNATKAKELGFIDKIMFLDDVKFNNSMTNEAGLLPAEVIEKVRNELIKKGEQKENFIPENNSLETLAIEDEISRAKLKLKLKLNSNIGE